MTDIATQEIVMSAELIKWNYENFFNGMYNDKDNKKDLIYLFLSTSQEAINFLSDEEKSGVLDIILYENKKISDKVNYYYDTIGLANRYHSLNKISIAQLNEKEKANLSEDILKENKNLEKKVKELKNKLFENCYAY